MAAAGLKKGAADRGGILSNEEPEGHLSSGLTALPYGNARCPSLFPAYSYFRFIYTRAAVRKQLRTIWLEKVPCSVVPV